MHLLYVPCASQEQAERLASALLRNKLAVCANISSTVTSMYEWEGNIQKEKEVILIIKTLQQHEAESFIESSHPYDTPCIISLKVDQVNPAFLNWAQQL